MLLMMFGFISLILSSLILMIFFFLSKNENWDLQSSASFECGFTSYFFSRFSFSMHYYLVGLIFLFLDLELCLFMPFLNEEFSSMKTLILAWMFVLILILSVLVEWSTGKLDWKF